MKVFSAIALAAILAGCAVTKPPVALTTRFDVQQAQEMVRPGVNIISGSALIRQNGGGVVTCAGLPILLVPNTAYASERMSVIYRNAERGFVAVSNGITFTPDDPAYMKNTRTTVCDAQGKFAFNDVADGRFFVLSNIVWNVGGPQGGTVMQAVAVSGGQAREIVLSP